MDLTDWELDTVELALVKLHNSYLDKRKKMRPSERAMAMANTKRIVEKVRAERESRAKK